MPRSGEQYEALRAASQRKIETAAITLFASRGFAATNMRDIAAEAGISAGLIYRHYPTKEDLFGALVSQAAVGLKTLAERFRADASPVDLIREFTQEFVADLAEDSGYAEFVLIMHHSFAMENGPVQVDHLAEQQRASVRAFEDLVRRGQELGRIRRGDPTELVSCYLATLSGLAMVRAGKAGSLVLPRARVLTGFLIEEGTDD